ncbi:MAG TPA: M20/M25/M40 family metallo-hydrolase [Bryobacteraceae bacterium]|nr:M20/M25/M40 family metallo-hydrolase [Bryobacteraceae bacterium]
MRTASLVLLASLCSTTFALAADRYPVDWAALEPETIGHFTSLIRIDTSNPPGNETQAVNYLKPILDRAGIETAVWSLDPTRANLVARIKGSGAKRPIIIMGHTDVVGVQRDKWPVDPFAALRKDGFIWGRGSSDDKSHVVSCLMTMLLLKRLNVQLDRDVIFIAEAGEEGTSSFGIGYLVDQHWNDIAAEYALAEGGQTVAQGGEVQYVGIATTEKTPRATRLIAHGTAGHGSRPRFDNAILHLAAAVAKFENWQPPMRLNDTTRAYFERLATVSPPEAAYRYNHISDPAHSEEIQRYLAEHEPGNYSVLRTSIVPTIIQGGFRTNVIPSQAEATLDIRALPDEDLNQLYGEMRRVINDSAVEIVADPSRNRPSAPPSRIDSEMFQALERTQKRMYPKAVTIPMMLTGATDNAQLRTKGVQAYGFGPVADDSEGDLHGAHSDQERIRESSIHQMLQYLWYTVLDIAAK